MCGELRENTLLQHLAIPEGAESTGTINPGLITAIDTLLGSRIKFCILYVHQLYPIPILIHESQVIELL